MEIQEVKTTRQPRKWQTLTGYGKAIPTTYMVRINKRWYRVKCCCFSNSGTCYITVAGEDYIVENYGDNLELKKWSDSK